MLIEEQIDKLFINFLQKNNIREYVFNILKDNEEKHIDNRGNYVYFHITDYQYVFQELASMEQRYNGNNYLISFQEKWHNEYFTFLTKYNVSKLKENINAYRLFRRDFYRINSQNYFFTLFITSVRIHYLMKILGDSDKDYIL